MESEHKKKQVHGTKKACESDTITNDWEKSNRYNYSELPPQDSLKNCSEIARKTFLAKVEHSDKEVKVSKVLINGRFKEQLQHIRAILDASRTDYHILATPAYCYTDPAIIRLIWRS